MYTVCVGRHFSLSAAKQLRIGLGLDRFVCTRNDEWN
jgi:hypothetical protein